MRQPLAIEGIDAQKQLGGNIQIPPWIKKTLRLLVFSTLPFLGCTETGIESDPHECFTEEQKTACDGAIGDLAAINNYSATCSIRDNGDVIIHLPNAKPPGKTCNIGTGGAGGSGGI
jgi:hypothetical protein